MIVITVMAVLIFFTGVTAHPPLMYCELSTEL